MGTPENKPPDPFKVLEGDQIKVRVTDMPRLHDHGLVSPLVIGTHLGTVVAILDWTFSGPSWVSVTFPSKSGVSISIPVKLLYHMKGRCFLGAQMWPATWEHVPDLEVRLRLTLRYLGKEV